jgi:hypothetical protein
MLRSLGASLSPKSIHIGEAFAHLLDEVCFKYIVLIKLGVSSCGRVSASSTYASCCASEKVGQILSEH